MDTETILKNPAHGSIQPGGRFEPSGIIARDARYLAKVYGISNVDTLKTALEDLALTKNFNAHNFKNILLFYNPTAGEYLINWFLIHCRMAVRAHKKRQTFINPSPSEVWGRRWTSPFSP